MFNKDRHKLNKIKILLNYNALGNIINPFLKHTSWVNTSKFLSWHHFSTVFVFSTERSFVRDLDVLSTASGTAESSASCCVVSRVGKTWVSRPHSLTFTLWLYASMCVDTTPNPATIKRELFMMSCSKLRDRPAEWCMNELAESSEWEFWTHFSTFHQIWIYSNSITSNLIYHIVQNYNLTINTYFLQMSTTKINSVIIAFSCVFVKENNDK